jgi:hypothetical protein
MIERKSRNANRHKWLLWGPSSFSLCPWLLSLSWPSCLSCPSWLCPSCQTWLPSQPPPCPILCTIMLNCMHSQSPPCPISCTREHNCMHTPCIPVAVSPLIHPNTAQHRSMMACCVSSSRQSAACFGILSWSV